MAEETRKGFVVVFSSNRYLGGLTAGGVIGCDRIKDAVVFADEGSAEAMGTGTVFAYVEATKYETHRAQKTLGQVAHDAARETATGPMIRWADTGPSTRAGWEGIALAVVEEHERRKR